MRRVTTQYAQRTSRSGVLFCINSFFWNAISSLESVSLGPRFFILSLEQSQGLKKRGGGMDKEKQWAGGSRGAGEAAPHPGGAGRPHRHQPTHVQRHPGGHQVPRLDTFWPSPTPWRSRGRLLLDVVDHAAGPGLRPVALEGLPGREAADPESGAHPDGGITKRKSRGASFFFLWGKLRVTSTNPSLYTCAIER